MIAGIMLKTVVITVFAMGSQAFAQEPIDKSIDALFDRFPTVIVLQETAADLDNTMLGKTVQAGHLGFPSSRSLPSSPARAPPSFSRVPSPSLRHKPGLPIPNVAARATGTGSQRQAVPVMAPYARGSGVSERESTQQHVEEEPAAKTEASLAEALEAKAKAKRAAAAKRPYDIKLFVKGDKANYPHDYESYVEHRIEDALENYQDHIQAVDVRMVAEGHRPLLYRFEVTAKSDMPGGDSILSKSKHAHPTFPEALDDMHDTLKRTVRREKEKRIDKKRSGNVQDEKEMLHAPGPSDAIAEAGDEEYAFEMKGARQEP
jgi:ribosomal subunit interface protein